ncbi:MAG: hypothetical protein V4501_09440 [Pseudomonadota bacterium]
MPPEEPIESKQTKIYRISKILNYIGATLIFFGICYWLSYNWEVLTSLSRVVLTLGTACWTLYIAASLTSEGKHPTSSGALFMLGGFLLPLGISVTLNAFGLDFNVDLMKMIAPGICFIIFLVLQLRYSREILLLFCLIFGSSFFIAGMHFFNNNGMWFPADTLWSYEALGLGLSYLLVAYGISFSHYSLTGWLCFLGDLLVLLASFYLGGLLFESNTTLIWEILTPCILLASFLLYLPFKNIALLCLSAVFLIIYITRLTYRFAYFFGTIGWPVVLIAAGVFLMLIALILLTIQKELPKKKINESKNT